MAGATVDGLCRLERVRSMATQALAVPAREQRAWRNDWLALAMAIDASPACGGGGCVLVLVARLTAFGL